MRAFFYFSSSTKWDFLRKGDFSYLRNVLNVERLSFEESKRILERRFEVISPGSKPPFSDSALRLLTSILNGNPRNIIYASGRLMQLAHSENHDFVYEDLISRTYGDEAQRNMQVDYEEILRSDKVASKGALLLWRACTGSPTTERKALLEFVGKLYEGTHQVEGISFPSRLTDSGCVKVTIEADGKKVGCITEEIVTFFDRWRELGHNISDFVDWYSEILLEPPLVPHSYQILEELYEYLQETEAKQKLKDSWDSYIDLETIREPSDILFHSWRMLQKLILAFCSECGTLKLRLQKSTIEDVAEFQALSMLGITSPDDVSFFARFHKALKLTKIRLQAFGTIASLYRECQGSSGRREAEGIKIQAKMSYEELLLEWINYERSLRKNIRVSQANHQ
jgi:hypothetical protein